MRRKFEVKKSIKPTLLKIKIYLWYDIWNLIYKARLNPTKSSWTNFTWNRLWQILRKEKNSNLNIKIHSQVQLFQNIIKCISLEQWTFPKISTLNGKSILQCVQNLSHFCDEFLIFGVRVQFFSLHYQKTHCILKFFFGEEYNSRNVRLRTGEKIHEKYRPRILQSYAKLP